MENTHKTRSIHMGRKVGRLREFLGIKQDVIADKLGISQQAVSKLEQSEHIEDDTLDRLAKAMGTTSEAIKNFTEEAAINIISSTLHDNAGSVNNNCTIAFNPLEKYVEAVNEIKALNEKNEKLYEALLKSEREKVALLEKLLNEKK